MLFSLPTPVSKLTLHWCGERGAGRCGKPCQCTQKLALETWQRAPLTVQLLISGSSMEGVSLRNPSPAGAQNTKMGGRGAKWG